MRLDAGLELGGVGGEKVAGEDKMIGKGLGLFEGFEDSADDFVLELVALDFPLGWIFRWADWASAKCFRLEPNIPRGPIFQVRAMP